MSLAALFAQRRSEFPGLTGNLVHLNNAAGSEMPERAITAMAAYTRSGFSNEGKIFPRLQDSLELRTETHQATAELIGASADEVGLGANTTTNLFSVSRSLARLWKPGERVLVSEACHEANIAPWLALRDQGISVDFIPMLPDTHLDYAWLEQNLDRRTRLVTFGASSNATGTMHDLERVISLARRASALVSLDAAHFAPHQPIDVAKLGIDLLFFSIYKCFGPHLGAFYIRRELLQTLVPFSADPGVSGSRTASHFETGTRSFEAYAGWLGALAYLTDLGRAAGASATEGAPTRRDALSAALRAIAAWEAELTQYGDARLAEVPGIVAYRQSPVDRRARVGALSFNLRGRDPLEVARALERAGIEAAVGNNGAVRTMARLAGDFGGIALRLSLAHYNTKADLDAAIECLLAA
jgi:cysteine desulfurase family protein (TIGR01976 family)